MEPVTQEQIGGRSGSSSPMHTARRHPPQPRSFHASFIPIIRLLTSWGRAGRCDRPHIHLLFALLLFSLCNSRKDTLNVHASPSSPGATPSFPGTFLAARMTEKITNLLITHLLLFLRIFLLPLSQKPHKRVQQVLTSRRERDFRG